MNHTSETTVTVLFSSFAAVLPNAVRVYGPGARWRLRPTDGGVRSQFAEGVAGVRRFERDGATGRTDQEVVEDPQVRNAGQGRQTDVGQEEKVRHPRTQMAVH